MVYIAFKALESLDAAEYINLPIEKAQVIIIIIILIIIIIIIIIIIVIIIIKFTRRLL